VAKLAFSQAVIFRHDQVPGAYSIVRTLALDVFAADAAALGQALPTIAGDSGFATA
jgi:hypothetical protein